MEQGNDDRGMKNITRNVIDAILKYIHKRNKENVVILAYGKIMNHLLKKFFNR